MKYQVKVVSFITQARMLSACRRLGGCGSIQRSAWVSNRVLQIDGETWRVS